MILPARRDRASLYFAAAASATPLADITGRRRQSAGEPCVVGTATAWTRIGIEGGVGDGVIAARRLGSGGARWATVGVGTARTRSDRSLRVQQHHHPQT